MSAMRAISERRKNYSHYDALLRRYAMQDSNGLSYFTWDANGMNLLCERDASGTVTAEYTHGYTPVPGVGTMVAAKRNEAGTSYYQYPVYGGPGISNVVRLVDQNGTPTAYYEYDAWGNVLREDIVGGTGTNRFRANSNYIDLPDSGGVLTWSGPRILHRPTGRYLSRDPKAGLAGGYVYCNGDPVNKVDPTGLSAVSPMALTGMYLAIKKHCEQYLKTRNMPGVQNPQDDLVCCHLLKLCKQGRISKEQLIQQAMGGSVEETATRFLRQTGVVRAVRPVPSRRIFGTGGYRVGDPISDIPLGRTGTGRQPQGGLTPFQKAYPALHLLHMAGGRTRAGDVAARLRWESLATRLRERIRSLGLRPGQMEEIRRGIEARKTIIKWGYFYMGACLAAPFATSATISAATVLTPKVMAASGAVKTAAIAAAQRAKLHLLKHWWKYVLAERITSGFFRPEPPDLIGDPAWIGFGARKVFDYAKKEVERYLLRRLEREGAN